jgi:hypothetical protein
MASARDIKRGRLKSNPGTVQQNIYLIPVDDLTTVATPLELTPETADHNVANITARDAIVSPTDGDIAYVASNRCFYKYVAASTSWVRVFKSKIYTSHVPATDKGFFVVQMTKNKKGLSITGPEDFDVTGQMISLTGSVPGMDEEIADFLMDSQVEDFIALVRLTNDKVIQIGTANNPASIKLNTGETGTEVLSFTGHEITISSESPTTYYYEGDITLLAE